MEPTLQSPPFTQLVVKAMRSLYPEELADRAWDNVGLLQENINPPSGCLPSRVLLTNDLTLRVAEEAIKKQASVIVSYHPFIFRGLKSVTLDDPHQRIVLRLAQHNIAVYSPHTAVDAVLGGVNDWLASILDEVPGGAHEDVAVVQPAPAASSVAGFEGAGYGRLVRLREPTDLDSILQAYAVALRMRHVVVSRPRTDDKTTTLIRSVAVCAGSGFDVLKDADADLIVTGEMTHHNALRLKMLGKSVLTVFHSNSERGFLREVLQPKLERILREEDAVTEVLVSDEDEDPFEIWEAKQ
ncbi:GTP cyclohydrolase 1 type 2/Nif3 [Corynascus novoguineensis]|uniref:GTP cyclohydrolase 1 type 2/Nif3 n=1 Tax=Corynascus novoguineensis TaxID=1126955 RepID=A0AAN7CXX0_9PEZI|nr:GTP cyclohydrolase 1 type 2/Nif3 [Corynascus novoguineensis]